MTKYNTGNPVGSADPRDLYDTATVADKLVQGTEAAYPDRLGVSRRSWKSVEAQADQQAADFDADQADRAQRFNDFLASSGYDFAGDYAAGIEITEYNQIIRDTAGEFWRASGSTTLPYTTTGAGLPEGGAFVAVGDAVLRQELAASAVGQGSDLIAHTGTTDTVTKALDKRTIYVGSVAEDLSGIAVVEGRQIRAAGWHPASGAFAYADPSVRGSGVFVGFEGQPKSDHNGGTIISPTVPPVSQQAGATSAERVANFLAGAGETDATGTGCYVLSTEGALHPEIFGALAFSEDASVIAANLFAVQATLDFAEGRNYAEGRVISGRGFSYTVDGDASLKIGSFIEMQDMGLVGKQATTNLLETKSLTSPAGQSNYDRTIEFRNCAFNSESNSAIKGRFWQCKWYNCTFAANNAKCLWFVADAYSTGNYVQDCYFSGYEIAIYGQAGILKPTDMYIINNRFWKGDKDESPINSILLEGASGTLISGNHYYGGATEGFLKFTSGGANVRITQEYYERNGVYPHIVIPTGNGATWTISDNSFWVSDDHTRAIDVNMNFRARVSMSGNTFKASVPIKVFSFLNETQATTILFNSTNMALNGFDPLGFGQNVVFEESSRIVRKTDTRYATLAFDSSEYIYTSATNSSGTVTLAIEDFMAEHGKSIILRNDSGVTTVSVGLNSSATDAGYVIKGPQSVAPDTSLFIDVNVVDKIIYTR